MKLRKRKLLELGTAPFDFYLKYNNRLDYIVHLATHRSLRDRASAPYEIKRTVVAMMEDL